MKPAARPTAIVLILLAVLAGGTFLGGHPQSLPGPIRDVFVDPPVALQAEALGIIERNFVDRVNGTKLGESLEDAGVRGAVDSLHDRFSAYLNPKQTHDFILARDGKYTGVGVSVRDVDRGLQVARVYRKSPAAAAGIERGDVIVAVDGNSIADETSEQASSRIRGPEGTTVKLTIEKRSGAKTTLEVRRSKIAVPLVEGRMVERDGKKFAQVLLLQFDRGATEQLKAEIARLVRKGAKGLVFDLRGNPGGLVDEAVSVTSLFVKSGVVVTTRARTRPKEVFDVSGDAPFASLPMVVLANRDTASASEIVAGALQDHDRAEIVGTRTFGKGVFQEVFGLSNGGSIDLTVGHYLTPDGTDLGGKGVQPNVKVGGGGDHGRAARRQLDAALDALSRSTKN